MTYFQDPVLWTAKYTLLHGVKSVASSCHATAELSSTLSGQLLISFFCFKQNLFHHRFVPTCSNFGGRVWSWWKKNILPWILQDYFFLYFALVYFSLQLSRKTVQPWCVDFFTLFYSGSKWHAAQNWKRRSYIPIKPIKLNFCPFFFSIPQHSIIIEIAI